MDKLLLKIEEYAGAWLLRLLNVTLRYKVQNRPPDNLPCVYALWHRDLLLLGLHRMDTNIAVMISASRDGQLIAGPCRHLGYLPVRGSTSRQGSQALKEMVRLARAHSLAITPDGPKGPVGSIQPGLFQLAFLARVPIIPVVAECNREWIFNSWDRFRCPKPFSRLTINYGEPIQVSSREDFQQSELTLREAFKNLREELLKN
ncbi:MAG: lysophospholipid acyltransferase family protein [Candidatus Syntrophosphaera sp.]